MDLIAKKKGADPIEVVVEKYLLTKQTGTGQAGQPLVSSESILGKNQPEIYIIVYIQAPSRSSVPDVAKLDEMYLIKDKYYVNNSKCSLFF